MIHAALGMIETYGYIGALAGADAAVKAAAVHIDRLEIVKGGIVTVFVVGDVGAVKAAVEAGENEANRVGKFRRSHVIAKVSLEVEQMLTQARTQELIQEPEVEEVNQIETEAQLPVTRVDTKQPKRTEEELKRMKVVRLRNIARSVEHIGIDRNRIKFATKDELVKAIMSAHERGKSDDSR